MNTIKLSVAEPCHENWQSMAPSEQGRFCSSCQKQVTDFSEMSNDEIYKTVLKGDANMCGRFSVTQLEREISGTVEKKSAWHKYFFSLLVPAFLLTKQGNAQRITGKVSQRPVCTASITMGAVAIREPVDKEFEFTGSVIDSGTKKIIPGASLQIKYLNYGMIAGSDGIFHIKGKTGNTKVVMMISAVGYQSKNIEITIPGNNFKLENETISLQQEINKLSEVLVTGGLRIIAKRKLSYELPKRIITAITDAIKIYPNPVQRGNEFTVGLKTRLKDNHIIQVIDAAGRVMLQKQLSAVTDGHNEKLQCGANWATGSYFIRVVNEKNKLVSASRFLVE